MRQRTSKRTSSSRPPQRPMHPRRPTTIPLRLPDRSRRRSRSDWPSPRRCSRSSRLAAPAQSTAPTKTRVTVIGDSITASFDYVPAARRYLGKGLDLRSDAVVCRRLVAASCSFQGATPPTALQVVGAQGRALGPVVVDQRRLQRLGGRVRRRPRHAGAQGGRRAARDLGHAARGGRRSNYAQSNARIRSAGKRWRKSLVVADWNAYSSGKPWFREDGLHLTTSGALGLARLLRPLVARGRL